MNDVKFFELQKHLLEEFFPAGWFRATREKGHPAYLRWQLCNKLIQQGGIIQYPEQRGEFADLGRIVLDSQILIAVTSGDPQAVRFGIFSAYGDLAVQKKIRSRIVSPGQFEDIMVELAFAAWNQSERRKVIPLEQDNYPDHRLDTMKLDRPVYVECKHLNSGSRNRILKEISKANSQLKVLGTVNYGVAVLDVSTPVAAGQVQGDELPPRLKEIEEIVQQAISGEKNRSVGAVILTWDDYIIMGSPPAKILVLFERRFVRILHQGTPWQPIPESLSLFEGYTVHYFLSWEVRRKPVPA